MKVERLTVNIGAEISGVNLGDAARDDQLFAQMRELLLKHRVLFFRGQDLDRFSRANHVALASRFGPLESHPVQASDPDYPGLVRIYRSDEKNPYENNYHTDGLWRSTPLLGSVLRCIECPEVGGDTIWVNMVEAYARLAQDIKDKIVHLHAHSSVEHAFGAVMPPEQRRQFGRDHPPVEHPVVRTHPETGEKVLFVGSHTTHFIDFHTPQNVRFGIDKNPGAALLLQYLQSQASIPEYQVRWRWKPDSVALWDNRATQHYAVMDYWPQPRKMERAGILGDSPY